MSDTIKRLRAEPDLRDVRAMAFDLSPEPSLVISADGSLAAANEAAEALFGQGLGLLIRGRFQDAMPVGSSLTALVERAVRDHFDHWLAESPAESDRYARGLTGYACK